MEHPLRAAFLSIPETFMQSDDTRGAFFLSEAADPGDSDTENRLIDQAALIRTADASLNGGKAFQQLFRNMLLSGSVVFGQTGWLLIMSMSRGGSGRDRVGSGPMPACWPEKLQKPGKRSSPGCPMGSSPVLSRGRWHCPDGPDAWARLIFPEGGAYALSKDGTMKAEICFPAFFGVRKARAR